MNWPAGILVGLALAALYLQRFLLRHEERLSSEQLADRAYRLRWVSWGYPLLKLGTIGCLILVLVYGFTYLPKGEQGRLAFLLVPVFASLPITEGCLALSTGVFDRPTREDSHHPYVYDERRRLRWVAVLEASLGCVIALAGVVGFLVYR